MRIILFCVAVLLLSTPCVAQEQGPFCGPVGTEGCDAIAWDSSAIKAWATGCTVVRGPVDITDPDGPKVHYGDDSMGIGSAGGVNTDAVSLGDGGTATLTFARPIRNGAGPDFAVFENSFDDYFLELGFVEVSTDGERYVRFPATSLTPTDVQIGSIGQVDATNLNNLAGKYRFGYGTPFDLEELRDSIGIDLDSIVYVRIVDVVGTIDPQYATYDAYGHIVNDPWPTRDTIWGSGGFDLTGVGVIHPCGEDPVGIGDVSAPLQINVYPNPATDCVIVTASQSAQAALYDFHGRMVAEFETRASGCRLDVSALPAGIYVLRVGATVHKLVVR